MFLKKVIKMGTADSAKVLSHLVKNSTPEQLEAFGKAIADDYRKLRKKK